MSKGWESKSVEEQQAERNAPVETRPKIDGPKERARQAREQAGTWADKGRDYLSQQKDQIRTAYEAGRQAYREATGDQVEGANPNVP